MLFDKKKQYQPLSDSEKKEMQGRISKSLEEIKRLSDAARACLEHPLFRDYSEKLTEGMKAMLELFLAVDLPTMEQEWKAFKQLQAEMNVLRNLNVELRKKIIG